MLKRFGSLAMAAALLAALGWLVPGGAFADGKVIMVVDSSGSMWGRIGGAAKVEVARKVIGQLLDGWDKGTDLGIVAYGHRRKGDCADIETVLPVGPLDPARARAVVNALEPRGKTPLTDAVRRAANELRYTEDKATVVLISDGLETCGADPCAAARELEAAGIDFTVHVVGFGLKSGEAEQLSCLAENTGGRFFSAEDAGQLSSALETVKQEVVRVQASPLPKPVPAGPQGLRLEAVADEGMEPITEDLFWWVLDDEADADGKRAEIAYGGSPTQVFELPVGHYVVRVRHGSIFRDVEAEVREGELTRMTVVLKGGYLKLSAIPTGGAEPLTEDMFYWVYSPETDLQGKRKKITYGGDPRQLFKLPAGTYHIVARHGTAFASQDIEIPAGKRVDYTFDMNVGYLRLSAELTQGSGLLDSDLFYWVYSPDKDLQGKRKKITYGGSPNQLFKLPAGKYHLVVRHGQTFAETDLEVPAGKLTEHAFDLNGGIVRLEAVYQGDSQPIGDDLFWWVNKPEADLNGKHAEVTYGGSPQQIFKLPAGTYQLVVRHRGVLTTTELALNAGEQKVVQVALPK